MKFNSWNSWRQYWWTFVCDYSRQTKDPEKKALAISIYRIVWTWGEMLEAKIAESDASVQTVVADNAKECFEAASQQHSLNFSGDKAPNNGSSYFPKIDITQALVQLKQERLVFGNLRMIWIYNKINR